MTKPESYPFLRIAKQFGVDYGAVLRAAHWVRFGGDLTIEVSDILDSGEAACDIHLQCRTFEAMQRREIDWITGEPPNPQMRSHVAAERFNVECAETEKGIDMGARRSETRFKL